MQDILINGPWLADIIVWRELESILYPRLYGLTVKQFEKLTTNYTRLGDSEELLEVKKTIEGAMCGDWRLLCDLGPMRGAFIWR